MAAAVFIFDVSIQTIHDLPDIFSSGLGIGGGRKTGLELFGMSIPFRYAAARRLGLGLGYERARIRKGSNAEDGVAGMGLPHRVRRWRKVAAGGFRRHASFCHVFVCYPCE